MKPNSIIGHLPPVLQAAELADILREHPAVRLLDVRTPAEFDTVHIGGAYNVPLDTLHEHAREIRASVQEPIVLLCQSGQRARRAEDTLARAGLSTVHVLDGGINAWIAAGLPVSRGPQKLSLERQVRIVAGAFAATGGLLALLVHPAFGVIPAFVGSGLVFSGMTNTCGMAMLLAKLPYNGSPACDVRAVVYALAEGRPPSHRPHGAAPAASRT